MICCCHVWLLTGRCSAHDMTVAVVQCPTWPSPGPPLPSPGPGPTATAHPCLTRHQKFGNIRGSLKPHLEFSLNILKFIGFFFFFMIYTGRSACILSFKYRGQVSAASSQKKKIVYMHLPSGQTFQFSGETATVGVAWRTSLLLVYFSVNYCFTRRAAGGRGGGRPWWWAGEAGPGSWWCW